MTSTFVGDRGKPSGVIQPHVIKVRPEQCGIVRVDCAKARSKWFFCDFCGGVLIRKRAEVQTQFRVRLEHCLPCY